MASPCTPLRWVAVSKEPGGINLQVLDPCSSRCPDETDFLPLKTGCREMGQHVNPVVLQGLCIASEVPRDRLGSHQEVSR